MNALFDILPNACVVWALGMTLNWLMTRWDGMALRRRADRLRLRAGYVEAMRPIYWSCWRGVVNEVRKTMTTRRQLRQQVYSQNQAQPDQSVWAKIHEVD